MAIPSADTSEAQRSSTWAETLLILLMTAMAAIAVLQAEPLQSANDRSRWATVWSLVERNTWYIDEIDQSPRWTTIDKVRTRDEASDTWHFYSSKPPFLSVLVAGLYALQKVTLGYGMFSNTEFVSRLLLLFVNVLPFCLALFSLRGTLRLLGASTIARMFILLAAGPGSISTPYLTTLNNHTPAVACVVLAISAAVRLLMQRAGRDFALLGFFAAMTTCFELPAAQLGLASFLLAVVLCRRQTLRFYVPAAALPLVFFFVTNWMATGSLKPFYATYGTETYVYTHNGIPSYWSDPRDLDANTESTGVYLFHCLLGHHGLFSLTPILLLSLPWPFLLRRRLASTTVADSTADPQQQQRALKVMLLAGTAMSLITLGFYLSRTQNYNYGGNSVGLRWMLWLSPFWWLAMIPVLQRPGRFVLAVALLLLMISTGTVQWSMTTPWRPSWLYAQMEARGWITYRTPRLPFEPPRLSVFSGQRTAGETATFVSSRGDRVRFEVRAAESGSTVVYVTEAVLSGQQLIPSTDLDAFPLNNPGQPLRGKSEIVLTDAQQVLDATIRSMFGQAPSIRPYANAGPIYTPSRDDPETAWKTVRAARRTQLEHPVLGNVIERVDVRYCDELPLGVLKWQLTITAANGVDILHAETWQAERW